MRKMAGITKAQCEAFGLGINWVQEHIIRLKKWGKVFYIYTLGAQLLTRVTYHLDQCMLIKTLQI